MPPEFYSPKCLEWCILGSSAILTAFATISATALVEEWPEYDLLGAMRQIGAIPEPGQE